MKKGLVFIIILVIISSAIFLLAGRTMADDPSIAAARTICYSALTGNVDHSLILVPLPNAYADLDAVCHYKINSGWHAGGVAKGRYFHQDCVSLDNDYYGGGYTSYVTEEFFEANRDKYPSCNETNAFICCSPQFPD